jgi:di/tripeptidase
VRTAIGGGSDVNALRLEGFECVLLANGPDAVHTADEHVAVRDLDRMLATCEGILAAAAAPPTDPS